MPLPRSKRSLNGPVLYGVLATQALHASPATLFCWVCRDERHVILHLDVDSDEDFWQNAIKMLRNGLHTIEDPL